MKEFKFEDLLTSELSELYDAEKQILRALPKMRDASTSDELAGAFEEHEQLTQEHVKRLDRIFAKIGETPGGKQCEGMRGLLELLEETLDEEKETDSTLTDI